MKRLSLYFSTAILTAHAFGAIAWLILMPRGFPPDHPRFWANQVLPWLLLAAVARIVATRWRRGAELAQEMVIAFPIGWACAAVVGIAMFPRSARVLSPMALIASTVMVALCRPVRFRRRPAVAALFAIAGAIGVAFPFTQRAPSAMTVPAGSSIEAPPADSIRAGDLPVQTLTAARVHVASGTAYFKFGNVQVDVAPLLTFVSRSPDRCWTIFSPRLDRLGPRRTLRAVQLGDRSLRAWYDEDDISFLQVDAADESAVQIDARTRLPRDVYSHLNQYCELTIAGHRALSLSFSPTGDRRYDVTYAGYPFGKPARFAYLDDDADRFRVVEASNAEKGPFTELGSGTLKRGEPLTMSLFDGGRPVAQFTFDDFSAQASTQLSPTAGWRVPVNSIQFALYRPQSTSAAGIWMTLSGTGIGRGWDSVGHRAGVYRNRVRVSPLGPLP